MDRLTWNLSTLLIGSYASSCCFLICGEYLILYGTFHLQIWENLFWKQWIRKQVRPLKAEVKLHYIVVKLFIYWAHRTVEQSSADRLPNIISVYVVCTAWSVGHAKVGCAADSCVVRHSLPSPENNTNRILTRATILDSICLASAVPW